MAYPLYVAFVWHMHQPYYKNTFTGEYTLPWVRLHATKDYLHMAAVLQDFPKVHQTFNFVPSLVEQIMDYEAGTAIDQCLKLTLKEELTPEDKHFMLTFFFNISWDKVIRHYPRYWQLLHLRNEVNGDISLLSEPFWRDLAAWFNLAWIDPSYLERDGELSALVDKGQDFTRSDLELIAAKHREICTKVLPTYRILQEMGQVEITTSPYFHPILPLLIDSQVAREASSGLALPSIRFNHLEDAVEQLRRAIALHTSVFGRPPLGLWPPEGAISQKTVEMLQGHGGWRWLASDEGVLARSLGVNFDRDGYGNLHDPRALCQPYLLDDGDVSIIFRDHLLSDRIGFVYKHWHGEHAAADLIGRLHNIYEKVLGDDRPYLVSIILDGENCWEEYPRNGDYFLHHLAEMLSNDPDLRAVTVSEFLAEHPPQVRLRKITAGSWINANVETWIGESEQNRAWECLGMTRARLIAWQLEYPLADFETLARAWQEIYIAEGSDWFWWYYSHNKTGHEQVFDVDFRTHLGNVYRIMGLPVPSRLAEPIAGLVAARARNISGSISPRLSTAETASLAWTGAGYVEPLLSTGAMQRASSVLKRLYFGYNPADLYLRIEANDDLRRYFVGCYVTALDGKRVSPPRYAGSTPDVPLPDVLFSRELALPPALGPLILSRAAGHGIWHLVQPIVNTALSGNSIELGVSLADLGLKPGDTVAILVTLARDEVLAETLPTTGCVSFTIAETS